MNRSTTHKSSTFHSIPFPLFQQTLHPSFYSYARTILFYLYSMATSQNKSYASRPLRSPTRSFSIVIVL